MRVFVPAVVAVALLYFWDEQFYNGKFLDGLHSMGRAIFHSMFP